MDLADLAAMRLSEHALHSWDVAVALDPAAPVAAPSAALVVDTVARLVGRTAKALPTPARMHVTTTEPARELPLTLG